MADTAFEPFPIQGPIGKSLVRQTGRAKVTGAAKYSAEWPIDGVLYAVPICSTIAKGRVLRIETAAAEQMPGVRLVMTPANAVKVRPAKVFGGTDMSSNNAQSIIPATTLEVSHGGQYLGAVVADTFEAARDAALMVKISYRETIFNTDMNAAKSDERPSSLMGKPPVSEVGDAEAALRDADVSVDLEFDTAPNHHNPIEPHATIALWESDTKLAVYDATQAVAMLGQTLATMFDLNTENVRVISQYVGGAFGSKGGMWPHTVLAVMCAKAAGAPVKLVVSREQMYGGTGFRTPIRQRVALGSTAAGKITSIIHEGTATISKNDEYVEAFTMATRMMYASDARRLAQKQVRLDTQLPTFMRAPAETPGMFALEAAVDELAEKLGIDPIELRLKNEAAKDPMEDKPFSGRHLVECLTSGAKAFGWNKRDLKPRATRDGRWLVGMGVAAATYPYFVFPATARVTIFANGTVLVASCTQEIGTGTATAQSQLAADLLGLPAERVRMDYGDTTLPQAGVSGGSSTTASVGGAVRKAIDDLKTQLRDLSKNVHLRGVDPANLTFYDGRLVNIQGEGMRIEEILRVGLKEKISAEGTMGMSMSKYSCHSFGAQFVEVGVDEEFGIVRLRRMLGCFACGTLLNARTARSQFLGGMVMGIGHAMMEKTIYDHRLGDITNDNIAEYHVPVNADVPSIDVMWIDAPDWNASPIGAKGIGEIGITGVAAAVANAVWHATGRRQRSLPITAESVMAPVA